MKINFDLHDKKEKHLEKKFLDQGPESGKIFSFPIRMILFSVLKINFGFLGKNKKQLVKEVF